MIRTATEQNIYLQHVISPSQVALFGSQKFATLSSRTHKIKDFLQEKQKNKYTMYTERSFFLMLFLCYLLDDDKSPPLSFFFNKKRHFSSFLLILVGWWWAKTKIFLPTTTTKTMRHNIRMPNIRTNGVYTNIFFLILFISYRINASLMATTCHDILPVLLPAIMAQEMQIFGHKYRLNKKNNGNNNNVLI